MAAKLGGGGGKKYDVGANADINVTPFVDVMLVLLIIFMVSIPMATVSIKLDLPPAIPNQAQPLKKPVFISIQKSGDLFLAEKKTSLDTLGPDLAASLGSTNPTNEQVFVRADAGVLYEQFMEVLNKLQDLGYYKIGLINEDLTNATI